MEILWFNLYKIIKWAQTIVESCLRPVFLFATIMKSVSYLMLKRILKIFSAICTRYFALYILQKAFLRHVLENVLK